MAGTRKARRNDPLCRLYVDLDDFEAVNVGFGHAAGRYR
jgi:GGDEF domain-containing protein